ncbi:MAG: hypothetical protein QOK15_372 [Nocardioidaceae bacterium]|nr:hypothetical protein [Nocardioidaceae bacterium]
MPARRRRTLPAWLVGSGLVAVAMGVMNFGTYGFTILSARLLGPVHYGALAALMGLLLIVNVVSLGLQATGARRVATAPHLTHAIESDILRVSYRSALVLALLCLVCSPVVSRVLNLDSWLAAALLALAIAPLTLMGGQLGVLQGERRWGPLALIFVAMGAGRLVLGTAALVIRPDALGAMAGVAAGAFVPAGVGWFVLRRPRPSPFAAAGPTPPAQVPSGLVRELAHNSHALLAFFALSNADVVLARVVLDEHDAGLYAGGLILTKAVLFLPQFVVIVAFPAMSNAASARRAQARSVALVLAIGAVTMVGVAVLSGLTVVFIGGPGYSAVQGLLWGFAGLGTLLALLQVMVYQLVARQSARSVYTIWVAVAVLVAGASRVGTVTDLLVWVSLVDGVLLVVLLVRNLLPARSGS